MYRYPQRKADEFHAWKQSAWKEERRIRGKLDRDVGFRIRRACSGVEHGDASIRLADLPQINNQHQVLNVTENLTDLFHHFF